MADHWNIGRPLPSVDPATLPGKGRPDWVQCDERFIERALAQSKQKEGGGWVVVDAVTRIGNTPQRYDLAGEEWVVWRADAEILMAPNACPHMGAELCHSKVVQGKLRCPWHGLDLGRRGHGDWQLVNTHDDGILLWAQLLHDEVPTEVPPVPHRPASFIHGAIRTEATCEPEDVVANRLDPWHRAHFHPHSFATLQMLSVTEDLLSLRVAFKVFGPVVVEVDCTFHAPTRRCIVMTITDGDGVGSVVETHASPIRPGRSALCEATIATSDRPGFCYAKAFEPLIRPLIEMRARQLWVEDVAYAERRYLLRSRALGDREKLDT